jgi:hypothetical protein
MDKVMEVLVNYLLKKQIIKLSYIENSFFLYKKLDKRVKLTSEVITLNYSSDSPYSLKNSTTSSVFDNKSLYLWFTKGSNCRYLPEAYLLFRRLLRKYQNVIFIIEGNPNKVLIIKNSILIASFSKLTVSFLDKKLMEDEYQIDNIITLNKKEYENYLEDSLKFLTINDLLNILNIKIDIKEIFIKTVYFLSLPLLVSSIVTTLLLAGYSFYLDDKREALNKEFRANQQSNREVKRTIVRHENENELYPELLNEFRYVDKTVALSNILKITDESNMTMFYIKIYDKNVDFIVKTSNSSQIPSYIKKLFNTDKFEDVKNLNTRKIRDGIVEVTMNAKLKEVK